jgi:hypothetical protein
MASESPKAIVLQTSDKQHIGFTLFHPDFSASKGECVFVIVPKNADLLETQAVSILLDIKEAGEYQWVCSGDEVVISFSGIETLKYSGDGTLVHIPSSMELGVWFPAPAKQ